MPRSVPRPSAIAASALALLVASAAPAADVWQIDPNHSSAQFAVTHLMISTVRGEFGKTSGTIEYDGKSVSSISVDAAIDASSVNTRQESRDKDLKSDHFFDIAKYPAITFKSNKVVRGSGGAFKLVGELTMHGVTKEVTLDVAPLSKIIKGQRGESRVAASATTKLSRKEFGMTWNADLDGGGVLVGDEVAVTIDIEAVRPPPEAPAAPAKK
jgi:polyisoprenoid-binding protein YceI